MALWKQITVHLLILSLITSSLPSEANPKSTSPHQGKAQKRRDPLPAMDQGTCAAFLHVGARMAVVLGLHLPNERVERRKLGEVPPTLVLDTAMDMEAILASTTPVVAVPELAPVNVDRLVSNMTYSERMVAFQGFASAILRAVWGHDRYPNSLDVETVNLLLLNSDYLLVAGYKDLARNILGVQIPRNMRQALGTGDRVCGDACVAYENEIARTEAKLRVLDPGYLPQYERDFDQAMRGYTQTRAALRLEPITREIRAQNEQRLVVKNAVRNYTQLVTELMFLLGPALLGNGSTGAAPRIVLSQNRALREAFQDLTLAVHSNLPKPLEDASYRAFVTLEVVQGPLFEEEREALKRKLDLLGEAQDVLERESVEYYQLSIANESLAYVLNLVAGTQGGFPIGSLWEDTRVENLSGHGGLRAFIIQSLQVTGQFWYLRTHDVYDFPTSKAEAMVRRFGHQKIDAFLADQLSRRAQRRLIHDLTLRVGLRAERDRLVKLLEGTCEERRNLAQAERARRRWEATEGLMEKAADAVENQVRQKTRFSGILPKTSIVDAIREHLNRTASIKPSNRRADPTTITVYALPDDLRINLNARNLPPLSLESDRRNLFWLLVPPPDMSQEMVDMILKGEVTAPSVVPAEEGSETDAAGGSAEAAPTDPKANPTTPLKNSSKLGLGDVELETVLLELDNEAVAILAEEWRALDDFFSVDLETTNEKDLFRKSAQRRKALLRCLAYITRHVTSAFRRHRVPDPERNALISIAAHLPTDLKHVLMFTEYPDLNKLKRAVCDLSGTSVYEDLAQFVRSQPRTLRDYYDETMAYMRESKRKSLAYATVALLGGGVLVYALIDYLSSQ